MKIIFIKDLRKQGKKGQIKEVRDGYAENYLIKNGYALPANKTNMQTLKNEQVKQDKEDKLRKKDAKEMKQKLEKLSLKFKAKTGKEDKMFGSISLKQVKEELERKGFNIPKTALNTDSALTTLGYHEIKINLFKDVVATIKIEIIK